MSQTSVGVDFTLETVQYKFATIIGELCGKPSVLSQFAVWLDLRLSEYKLKGSISLDCSGLKPDPDWLQGLKDTAPPRTHHPADRPTGGQHGHSRLSREAQQSERTTSCGADNAESPDIVVIKEEQNDSNDQEVYPVGLHENNTSTSSAAVGRVERKRFSDTNDLSPAKYQRFSSPLPQASHASFSQELSLSSHDQSLSRITETSVDSELEQFIQDNSGTYPRGHNSTAYADQGGNNSAEFFSASVLQDSSESAHSTDLKSTTIEETRGAASSSDADDNRCFTEAGLLLQKSGVRFTAVDTIRKTVSAVRGLQSWLRTRFAEDHRRIEDMPPAELDEYLAEFFSDIKTRDGGEYHPSSFNSLRSAIERYLQQKDYGYSIISSSVFKKSQQSYKARKASLYKQRQVTEFINESLQPPTN